MVGLQRSSQPTSSAKKQQSISNFFTKTAISGQKPPPQAPKLPIAPANEQLPDNADDSLFLPVDTDVSLSPSSRASSYLASKRKIDDVLVNTENGDFRENLPPRKRNCSLDTYAASPLTEVPNGQLQDGQMLAPIAANQVKKPQLTERTSKFAYSSSPAPDEENCEDDHNIRTHKERLHERFVKKLGRPDSLAEIKRRSWQSTEEITNNATNPEDALDPDDLEEQELPKASSKTKRSTISKKGGSKLKPLDRQFLDIKQNHLDTILIVEVGYKFRFWGEDARIASKECGIVCIPGKMRFDEHISEAHLDRFASASIPVHRLHHHVKRLINAGHKVGVVRQKETAALKAAGDNRNAPFIRELTNVYTKGTYIDDIEEFEEPLSSLSGGAPATGYLVCITESNPKGWGTDEKVHFGLIAVQPATGDVIYDDFDDGFMRSEVETRLLHIAPCEILVVGDLSKATDKIINHLASSKANVFGDRLRVERIAKPKTMAAQAYNHVSGFYASKMKVTSSQDDEASSKLLDKVLKLPDDATICLSAMITHMTEYGLEHVFDLTKYFQSFSARSHMLLNGTTLTSLEIYQNQTDQSGKGSLFWSLDRTKTRFGQRLLRKWVGRPLLIRDELKSRIAAVDELVNGEHTIKIDKLKNLLSQVRCDLEKSLIRIYYGKV